MLRLVDPEQSRRNHRRRVRRGRPHGGRVSPVVRHRVRLADPPHPTPHRRPTADPPSADLATAAPPNSNPPVSFHSRSRLGLHEEDDEPRRPAPPTPARALLASAALVTVQQAILGHSNNLSIFRAASLNLSPVATCTPRIPSSISTSTSTARPSRSCSRRSPTCRSRSRSMLGRC